MHDKDQTPQDVAVRDQLVTSLAKDRLDERKRVNGFKRLMTWMFAGLGLLFVLLLAGGGYGWHYYQSNAFYTDRDYVERACKIKVGNDFIQGRRYYTYHYRDLFGVRLYQTDNVDERTELFVRGQGYQIVGHKADGDFWDATVKQGEVGVEPLNEATMYTVFSNGKVGNVSYDGFCVQAPNKSHPFATTME